MVADCNYCGSQMEFTGTFHFGAIEGDGTYALSIVLAGPPAPPGDGNEIFLAPGTVVLQSTPEPGTLALLGSAVVGLAGWIRRKSLR